MDREDKPPQESAGRREEFLERWSRRKLDARQDDSVLPAEDAMAGDMASVTDEPDELLTDADMPPIESLDESSDYSPFLSPGVSDGLRQQAMRKLFAQPGFNITDGLNDYDEDFTQFTGLGNVITHEMKRMLQRELEAGAEPAAADAAMSGRTTGPETPAQEVAAGDSVNTDGDKSRVQGADTDENDTTENDTTPG